MSPGEKIAAAGGWLIALLTLGERIRAWRRRARQMRLQAERELQDELNRKAIERAQRERRERGGS